MAAKAKRIEDNKVFIGYWETEARFSGGTSHLHKDRDAKQASLKIIPERCNITGNHNHH